MFEDIFRFFAIGFQRLFLEKLGFGLRVIWYRWVLNRRMPGGKSAFGDAIDLEAYKNRLTGLVFIGVFIFIVVVLNW